jgi:hypothetical protein
MVCAGIMRMSHELDFLPGLDLFFCRTVPYASRIIKTIKPARHLALALLSFLDSLVDQFNHLYLRTYAHQNCIKHYSHSSPALFLY